MEQKLNGEQKFIGIKIVSVIDMTAEVAEKNGYRTSGNTGDGVEVTYEDGYKSWCPLDVFKKNNFAIHNEELASTCKMMVSEDYKDRFLAEYIQLKNRYDGLNRMLYNWDKGKLPFTPTCPRETYDLQVRAMKDYLSILVIRAKMEGIDLPEDK